MNTNGNTPVTSEELISSSATTETVVAPKGPSAISKFLSEAKAFGGKLISAAFANAAITLTLVVLAIMIASNPGVPTLAEAPGFSPKVDDRNVIVASWDYLVGNPSPEQLNAAATQTKLDGNDAILFSIYQYDGKTYLAALGSRSVWSW